MDEALALARLIEEFNLCREQGDQEGAEAVLYSALELGPDFEAFVHFQFGRLYGEWNKLTSAINHLSRAAELLDTRRDVTLWIQVTGEIESLRQRQALQKP